MSAKIFSVFAIAAIIASASAEAETSGVELDDRTAIPPGGWGSAPPPPGGHVNISLSGESGAAGYSWAGEGHSEDIHVSGDTSYPADVGLGASGESTLFQDGTGVQASSIDSSETASSINAVSTAQGADANEGLYLQAQGNNINAGQQGWAAANGWGASLAGANSSMIIS